MPDVSYVPGVLTAVAVDRCLALIEAAPGSPVVARIWAAAAQGAPPDAVLGVLLADGLGAVPGFVLLATGDDGTPRLFCRGTVGATVYGGGPPNGAGDGGPAAGGHSSGGTSLRIDGSGLLTWRELAVTPDVWRIVLGEPPDGGALRLPAASGVLLAGCVLIDLAAPVPAAAVSGDALPQEDDDAEDIIKTVVLDTGAQHALPYGAAGQSRAGQGPASQGPARLSRVPQSPAGNSPVTPGTLLKDTVSQDEVPRDTVTDAPVTGMIPAGTGDGGPESPHGHPDTITMTTPGRLAGHEQGPAAGGAAPPWQPPSESAWSGPAVAGSAAAPGGARTPQPGVPLPPMPAPARAPGAPAQANPPGSPATAQLSGTAGQPSPPGGLIDVPPWLAAPGPPPSGEMPAWAPPQSQAPQLQPPQSSPSWPQGGEDGAGQPGATLPRADLPVLAAAPPDRIGPVVPALICPAGHVNPPSGAACRRCGAPLPHDPVPVPRPVLGVLRLSLGGLITLDRGVIMGRNPRADFAGPDGEERPHVVRLPSADGDISRNHVRVDLDGWHVLVTDLNSTNGTLVTLPGRDPQQLRPGEPVPIQPDTVVTLADGIDFRYEVTE